MELINFTLYKEFIAPLFEGKNFDQYLIILMVRSLANVIFKKIWLRLIVLRQRLLKTEENALKQKKIHQDRKMSDLAMSAAEQINQRVEKLLEPKLDVLLSKKVKVPALKTKPQKKEQHYKFKHTTREQQAKEPQIRHHSVDSESTLAKFAKRHIGVELSFDNSSDDLEEKDNRKSVGKARKGRVGKTLFPKKVLKLLLIVTE